MKKIVLGVLGLGFLFSFSYGAVLSLSPSKGNIPENCIESFNVNLNMDDGDEALAMDLIVRSNMEFVNFEKGELFKYSVPSRMDGDTMYFALLNGKGLEISQGGIVGTLYYNTTDVNDPYIEFVFDGVGNTKDTNVSIEGRDILRDVISGNYTISKDMHCENPAGITIVAGETYDIDDFIKDYKADHKVGNILLFLNRNKWYILGIVGLLIVLVLVSYKVQKKG